MLRFVIPKRVPGRLKDTVQQQVVEPKGLQPEMWEIFFRIHWIHPYLSNLIHTYPYLSIYTHLIVDLQVIHLQNLLAAGLNSRVAAEFCVEFESYTDVTCFFSEPQKLDGFLSVEWDFRLRTALAGTVVMNHSWRIHATMSCESTIWSEVLRKKLAQNCQPGDVIVLIAGIGLVKLGFFAGNDFLRA